MQENGTSRSGEAGRARHFRLQAFQPAYESQPPYLAGGIVDRFRHFGGGPWHLVGRQETCRSQDIRPPPGGSNFMTIFERHTYPEFEKELAAASELARRGGAQESFRHLERAHILGQTSTVQHLRVHWQMLRWGWRYKDAREVLGQILRIVGAAVATPVGMLPLGNTGGAYISPFRPMHIPQELAELLPLTRQARTQGPLLAQSRH